MNPILKEIKSNHFYPRKEEVDEYIASQDKKKYRRNSILRRAAVSSGMAATGSGLGALISYVPNRNYVKGKDFLKFAGIAGAASAIGGGVGGAIAGNIRNKRVERLANNPELYEKEFRNKYPDPDDIKNFLERSKDY